MPLGGGAFRNPWNIIAESMVRALEMLGEDMAQLEVIALTWEKTKEDERLRRELRLLARRLKPRA